jgi:phospholipid/cholesterol/gamma-HCH transport system permease protein
VSRVDDAVVVRLAGAWRLRDGLPPRADLEKALAASPPPHLLRLDTAGVESWDTALVAFLAAARDLAERHGVSFERTGVPEKARRLLDRAPRAGAPAVSPPRADTLVEEIGAWALEWGGSLDEKVRFVGATAVAVARALLGRARRLRPRYLLRLREAGVETLPVVALMGFAIGAVLTLIAVGQFQKIGATGLVARLVAITVLREMGSLMVGIAVAGRMGSAVAAEIATMVANQEVDALRVIGVDPLDYLVAPRVLALAVAGVLLVIYANALALAGGLFAGVALAGLPAQEYLARSLEVLGYKHLLSGLVKGLAFGLATGLVACYHGLRSGRTPGAVGLTVRRAVVGAVVGVVLADAAITLVFKWVRF